MIILPIPFMYWAFSFSGFLFLRDWVGFRIWFGLFGRGVVLATCWWIMKWVRWPGWTWDVFRGRSTTVVLLWGIKNIYYLFLQTTCENWGVVFVKWRTQTRELDLNPRCEKVSFDRDVSLPSIPWFSFDSETWLRPAITSANANNTRLGRHFSSQSSPSTPAT